MDQQYVQQPPLHVWLPLLHLWNDPERLLTQACAAVAGSMLGTRLATLVASHGALSLIRISLVNLTLPERYDNAGRRYRATTVTLPSLIRRRRRGTG